MNTQHIADEKLVAFAAGELDPADAQLVASHTASCADCAKTVTSFQTIQRLVRAEDTWEPPRVTVMRARTIFQTAVPTPHIAYEQLIAFAADDVDDPTARAVTYHIASCTTCAETVTRFRTIRAVMRADPSANPPAAVVARARAIFTQKPAAASPLFGRRWGWSIPAPTARRWANAFVLILLVLSNFIVYAGVGRVIEASQTTIPGDSFYQVKLVMEDIQLATTWDTAGKLARHLTYAGYRLDETGALIALDRIAEIPSTLVAFEKQVGLVTLTFKTLARENLKRAQELAPQIEATLSEQTAKLDTLSQMAAVIQPAFQRAIQASTASRTAVRNTYAPLLPTATPIVPPLPTHTRVFDSSSSQPIAPTLTKAPPAILPRTATPAQIQQPTSVSTSTPIPTKPPVISTATPAPTKSPVISAPTATRTLTPSKTIEPTRTPRPTQMPPGLEKKTLTPVPWNRDKSSSD